MTKAELQYLLIQRQKSKSGTKDELVQRLQALCKTHGDQAHYALQVAAKNLTMMEQALKSEWAVYHMSGNESWFHLLCDNCFACGHAEILSILPNPAMLSLAMDSTWLGEKFFVSRICPRWRILRLKTFVLGS
jgi:hypothetical protein